MIRNRGICLVAGRSGEADEAVVFAVGFHVPGVFRGVEGGVVRVVEVSEHRRPKPLHRADRDGDGLEAGRR